MIFKLSATSRYLFWVRWFVFSCGYIFWKPVISMCRRGARWISPPKHRKMCNTSLTQPCHRSHIYIYSHIQIPYNYSQISHIFPYFGYQFHPRRAWLECATKKNHGQNDHPVSWGDLGKATAFPIPSSKMFYMWFQWMIGWSDEGFTICDDHPLWFQYAKSNGPLVVPLIFQNLKDPKTFPTFYCRILSIFVHHISTSNHLPAPGKGTSSSALALGDGAWRSERSV